MDDKKHATSKRGRRDFLRGAGKGAMLLGGASLVSSGISTAAENSARKAKTVGVDYDVIVIGGGFAGVAAARDCEENGIKTLLLEARNRLGGRTFASEFMGHHVEFGGTWIHWTQPFVWAEKERYGLEVSETPGAVPETFMLMLDGKVKRVSESEMRSVVEAFYMYTAEARTILSRPYDIKHHWNEILEADKRSAQDHLDALPLSPLQRQALSGMLCSAAHNVPTNLSYVEALRWFSLAGFNDFLMFADAVARYKFKAGTNALIDAMMNDGKADLELATPVSEVTDKGKFVKITAANAKSYTAARVILTVPMNVLPSIKMTPPLPAPVVQAAEEKHTGQGVKLYIRVKGKLGRVSLIGGASHALSNVFTYEETESHTLLVAFAVDRDALDYSDDAQVQKALRDFLPDAEVDGTVSYDWVLDPFAKGTYPSYKPGWMGKYYDSFQQDQGRIHFASGDHGEGWRGFIDGAIGAGICSAHKVSQLVEQEV